MTELVIPYPPSANRLWTRTRRGMRKTDLYCEWLKVAAAMVRQQVPERIAGPYHLTIQALRPDRRRRDIDNLIKPISDLLQACQVISDDTLCEWVSARWVTNGAPCTVRIEKAVTE